MRKFILLITLLFLSLSALQADPVVATWNFATDKAIQEATSESGGNGKTFTLSSDVDGIDMYVDATNGTFSLNWDAGQSPAAINSVHINSGTKMYVPIEKIGDQVTIVTTSAESLGDNPTGSAYHPNTITIGGAETLYVAGSSDVLAGWVCIVATTDTYVESVTVQYVDSTVPLLLAFSFNDEEYSASDVFEYDNEQEAYVGRIEISRYATAPASDNLPEVVEVENGEVNTSTVAFTAGEENGYATVTITLTDGNEEPETTTTYILYFTAKPNCTVSYYYDGSLQEEQQVEKDATIGFWGCEVSVVDKVTRGWYYESGRKATVDDVVTEDVSLYALINDEEVSSGDSSWDYDLRDPYFYPEDHELIAITGSYSDDEHGWKVEELTVEVSRDAFIILGMCGKTTGKVSVTLGGEVASEFDATQDDGETYTYHYQQSEGGRVTFTFGTGYLHYVHVRNIAQVDIEEATENGEDFYWVEPSAEEGERASLLVEILEIVNSLTNDGRRVVVFLPDGVYDLGSVCLPAITRDNVSIVGQSMEGTIIKNSTNFSSTRENALLVNNSTGLYLQDLTLQNDYPYYEKSSDRRGVCLLDKGAQTICKNVALRSYQNTFYTYNDSDAYLSTCSLHGTLDFILGSGNVFFDQCTIYVEGRKEAGVGSSTEAIITSPNTAESCHWGYVFNNCYVTGVAAQTYSWGRAWSNTARCVWINTVLDEKINMTNNRWYLSGTSANIVPHLFAEYGTSPASSLQTATFNGTLKTIALAEEADSDEYTVDYYSYENIFLPSWDPQSEAEQVELAELVAQQGSSEISWTEGEDAGVYAVFLSGVFCGFTEETSYILSREVTEGDVVEVRGCNPNGGLGKAISNLAEQTSEATHEVTSEGELLFVEYYDLTGRKLTSPQRGINIVVYRYTDGSTRVVKKGCAK